MPKRLRLGDNGDWTCTFFDSRCRKTSKRIYAVLGGRLTRKQLTSRPYHLWPEFWKNWERMPSWRRSKSGHMKSTILIMHENCEGSISFARRIRNSRKPSRMLVRNLKYQLLLLCPPKLWRRIVGMVHPSNKIKTRLACILEASESTRLRMGESLPTHHEDHIAGKGYNSLQHYNLVHKFIPMPQAMKIPAAKAAVDQEWEKLEKISAWNLTKVRSKKEVIDEARTKGIKVHFASLKDICHLKNAELEAKHQKYKGRVVLRGDIVKDDSGSYAVFTEQGSSASQMTAAKVVDIISRLPGCAGQAADAVSAEDAPKLLKIPKSESSDIWIRLPRHKWPKSWSSMEDPAVPLERNLHGHPLVGMVGRKFQIGSVSLYIVKKDYSYLCMWMTSNWLERNKTLIRCGNYSTKWIWENQHISLIMYVYLGCTQKTMWNKQGYCW